MIITNALDMFNSLFDKKLESDYLWSFKSGIQNKTIAYTLQAVEVLISGASPARRVRPRQIRPL